jgi:hypothetical protein
MEFGTLGFSYKVTGMIYELAFELIDDPNFTKEDAVESLQEILKKMDELTDLIRFL